MRLGKEALASGPRSSTIIQYWSRLHHLVTLVRDSNHRTTVAGRYRVHMVPGLSLVRGRQTQVSRVTLDTDVIPDQLTS
jgi:hypothetical protein